MRLLPSVSAGTVALMLATSPVNVATSKADDPVTLTVSIQQGIDSLNPFQAVFTSSTQVQRLVYDSLTLYRESDNTPGPGLAESWTTSADGLVWTYRIRSGVKFSDGQPLTARDIAFTYDLMMRDAGARKANGNAVVNFESVSAPDDTTFVVRTKVPTPTMLALDIPIVPAHVWRGVQKIAEHRNDTFPVVGSGPFELVEYKVDEFLRFRANKQHWAGAPKIDFLVLRYFKNNEAAVQALRKGEVDLVDNMTPGQFAALEAEPGVQRNQARPARFIQLSFNPGAQRRDGTPIGDGHPALADQRVRAAVEHAIDKRVLADKALGEPGQGYLPPVYGQWKWAPSTPREFDLGKANKILDDAGYPRGADGVRAAPGGRPLKVRLYAPAEQQFYQLTGQHLVGWLRETGIQVDLQVMASTRLNDLTGAGTFDLYLGGWRVKPDPDEVLSVQTCDKRPAADGKAGSTDSFHCDAEYDRLYFAQGREVDERRRSDLVRQLQQRLHDTAAQVTLFYPAGLEAYRADRFTDLKRRPEADGTMIGPWAYRSATPVTAAATSGFNALPVLVGAGLLLLAAGGFVWHRRRTAHERE